MNTILKLKTDALLESILRDALLQFSVKQEVAFSKVELVDGVLTGSAADLVNLTAHLSNLWQDQFQSLRFKTLLKQALLESKLRARSQAKQDHLELCLSAL